MRLSQDAKQMNVSYKTAFRWWKAGRLDAYQLDTGTIIVRDLFPETPTPKRHLSRCKKGSKNREKARHQVARLHARIANIREDVLHQATSSLVHTPLSPSERISLKTHLASLLPLPKTKAEQKRGKKQVKKLIHQTTEINAPLRPQIIVLEDLHVEGMKRNRKLARAVSDVGMGAFRRSIDSTVPQGRHIQRAGRLAADARARPAAFRAGVSCHAVAGVPELGTCNGVSMRRRIRAV